MINSKRKELGVKVKLTHTDMIWCIIDAPLGTYFRIEADRCYDMQHKIITCYYITEDDALIAAKKESIEIKTMIREYFESLNKGKTNE
jgi:hypothetical protein